MLTARGLSGTFAASSWGTAVHKGHRLPLTDGSESPMPRGKSSQKRSGVPPSRAFFSASTALAQLISEKDWSQTALGPIENWSANLRFCVDLILASQFPMAIRWGAELTTIYNDAYVPILRDRHPQVLGAPLKDVWPEIFHELGPLSLSILRGEREGFFEEDKLWRIRRQGGYLEDTHFTVGYSPIPDASAPNSIGGVLVTAIEITHDNRNQQILLTLTDQLEQEVEDRTRERDRIWQVSEDLLGVSNFDGYFLSFNPAWRALLGWSEQEIKQMHVDELRHPDDAPASKEGRARLAAGAQTVRMVNRFRHKDGSWRWLHWTMTAEDGLIYVIGRHITSDKEAAEQLRESERQFRLLVDAVKDYAVFKLTPKGIVSSWNSGAERIKGYKAGEILGRHFSKFYTEVDRNAGVPAAALRKALEQGRCEMEGWRVRKDGSEFWANVVIDPIYDEVGEHIGFAKITRDITERREAQLELQRTQEKLAHAQKMDALGQLTGGISHDFNNMLMVISGYTQFLKSRLTEPNNRRAIEAIEHAASRGENLTRQLLSFSRRQSLNPQTVDMAECLGRLQGILKTSVKGNVDLRFDLHAELWPITVDLNEFEVAIINLVVNARDALPDGGTVTVSARNETLTTYDNVGLTGDFVAVTISDNGVGIPPEILPKVFDPFFTTKEIDKGTGLGLSQVYGFAYQADGTVKILSEVGVGTTITLYFPRETGASGLPAKKQQQGIAGGNEVILLVEDNRDVQAVASTMLEQLGYRVLTNENAADALDALKSGNEVDLVITDVVMPGPVDGLALARQIGELYPDMPIVLTTGYSKVASESNARFPVLRKPYQLSTLAHAVRNAIDNKDPARSDLVSDRSQLPSDPAQGTDRINAKLEQSRET